MGLQGDIDESQEWFLQEPGVMRLPKTIIMMMKKKRKLPTNHLQAFFQFKHMETNFQDSLLSLIKEETETRNLVKVGLPSK